MRPGDYQKGVDILADMLVDSDDPNPVYNQGRCYEQNGRWEQPSTVSASICARHAKLSDGDRADVERHIDEREKAFARAAPAAQPAAAAPAPVARVETPAPAPAPSPVARDVSTSRHHRHRTETKARVSVSRDSLRRRRTGCGRHGELDWR